MGMDFNEMQDMQKELQEKYRKIWKANSPVEGRTKLLWMIGEAGEVADIIKKDGDEAIMNDSKVRAHFTEELCDVLMYFNDIMLCYDIQPADIEESYRQKHDRNMKRW